MSDQLALRLPPRARRGAFLAGACNAAARRWLAHVHDWPEGRLALWGGTGCGKSHLAAEWAGADGVADRQAADYPRVTGGRLAIDDADVGTDDAALLHLLNGCAETGTAVLLVGRTAPARWPVGLPDLASRLRAMQSVQIEPPEDALLVALLARTLTERQLRMAEPVRDWLLARLPRTGSAVIGAVERLDQASLERQNAVTIPLAAAALRDVLDPAAEFADGGVAAEAGLPAQPA